MDAENPIAQALMLEAQINQLGFQLKEIYRWFCYQGALEVSANKDRLKLLPDSSDGNVSQFVNTSAAKGRRSLHDLVILPSSQESYLVDACLMSCIFSETIKSVSQQPPWSQKGFQKCVTTVGLAWCADKHVGRYDVATPGTAESEKTGTSELPVYVQLSLIWT